MSTLDLAWLAGLLEGEGSFMHKGGSPCIGVQMTDLDVLERAAALMGVEVQSGWKPRGPDHYKRVGAIRLHGTRAISWMLTLYTFLGLRRRAKIRDIVAAWVASPRMPRAPRGQRFMATCHPERVRCGHGLCRPCYMRQWSAKRRKSLTHAGGIV